MLSVEELDYRYYKGRPDWQDGTTRYRKLVEDATRGTERVLDIGPGTGETFCHSLKGKVGEFIGLDPHPAVEENDDLDRGIVGSIVEIPFPEEHFDVVVSSFALEHIEQPRAGLRELHRVLRPGGRFVFRTPNVWHYVGLISRLTPQWFHNLFAHRARGLPPEHEEPHPTYYCFNSLSRIRTICEEVGFDVELLQGVEAEPSYMRFNSLAFLLGLGYERFVNSSERFSGLRAFFLGVLR